MCFTKGDALQQTIGQARRLERVELRLAQPVAAAEIFPGAGTFRHGQQARENRARHFALVVIECIHMASRSLNKVHLIGNLGRDAETRFTPSGAAVTKFSVATSRRWKDQQSGEWKEETDWINIVLWRAENLANYLTRGKQVYVEGRIQTRTYDDKDGKKVYVTEVVADDVILLGGRGEGGPPSGEGIPPESRSAAPRPAGGGQAPRSRPSSAPGPAEDPGFDQGITEDDVPF
jgi:single-strand DNA-binding protein